MGESKRRGSREQRITHAVAAKKQQLDDIKTRLGVPLDAEFCGYVVRNREKQEYIHSIEDLPALIERTYTSQPDLAMRFERFKDAYQHSRPGKEDVIGLFERDGEFLMYEVLGA
jgi:hypothetical protein